MQLGQIAAETRPRQHRADDDIPQRVADEAVGRRQTTFREINLQLEWVAGKTVPPTLLTSDTVIYLIIDSSLSMNWFQQMLFGDSYSTLVITEN